MRFEKVADENNELRFMTNYRTEMQIHFKNVAFNLIWKNKCWFFISHRQGDIKKKSGQLHQDD